MQNTFEHKLEYKQVDRVSVKYVLMKSTQFRKQNIMFLKRNFNRKLGDWSSISKDEMTNYVRSNHIGLRF